jgi:hypothetical protein
MRRAYSSRREKQIDLWVGFGGWILACLVVLVVAISIGSLPGQLLAGMLLPATIVAVIVLALTRTYAAFGLGLAVSALVVLVAVEIPFILLGLFIDVATGGPHTDYCANSRGLCIGPPITTVVVLVWPVVFLVASLFSLRAIHRRIR